MTRQLTSAVRLTRSVRRTGGLVLSRLVSTLLARSPGQRRRNPNPIYEMGSRTGLINTRTHLAILVAQESGQK